MTLAAIAAFITQFGPAAMAALPMLEKLYNDIATRGGNTTATPADWAELSRLRLLTADAIYAAQGVTPPPPTPTV